MRFWKKKNTDNPTLPLTHDRLGEMLERIGWDCEDLGGIYHSVLNGFDFVFKTDGHVVTIYALSSGHYVVGERWLEALEWSNSWNTTHLFGTACPYVDDEGDVMMRISTSLCVGAGVSDAQCEAYLDVGAGFALNGMGQYINDLKVEYAGDEETPTSRSAE